MKCSWAAARSVRVLCAHFRANAAGVRVLVIGPHGGRPRYRRKRWY
jgi:hypothetical protein